MIDDSNAAGVAAEMAVLERLTRLSLPPGRAETVAAALAGVMQSFDALDDVDLGETAPTNAFDPRWRDAP